MKKINKDDYPIFKGQIETIIIRPIIIEFALQMEKVMKKHDPVKGESYKKMTPRELLDGLYREVDELSNAHEVDGVMHECVDIANFAMLLYTNLKDEIGEDPDRFLTEEEKEGFDEARIFQDSEVLINGEPYNGNSGDLNED